MSTANLWFNHSPTYKIAANCLTRYGQFFKWKGHKETILDVGCGDGKITEGFLYPYLKDRVLKLVAVDKDGEMVKFAKEHSRIGNIEYRIVDVMDEGSTKEFENKFDKTFTAMVAPWMPDNRLFFQNLGKMLKDHGQIFVVTVSDSFFNRSYGKQLKEGTWSKYLPHRLPFFDYTNVPVEYFKKLLESSGYHIDFCKGEKEFYSVDNCKGFVTALVQMTGDLEKIPVELREDYVMDHYRNSCKLGLVYLGEPDRYDVPYELMVGIATKIA